MLLSVGDAQWVEPGLAHELIGNARKPRIEQWQEAALRHGLHDIAHDFVVLPYKSRQRNLLERDIKHPIRGVGRTRRNACIDKCQGCHRGFLHDAK